MYYSVCVHFKLNVFLYFSFDLSEETVIQYLEVYIFNMNVIIAKGKQSLTDVGLTVSKILIGNYP